MVMVLHQRTINMSTTGSGTAASSVDGSSSNSIGSLLTRSQRLILGAFVLLLVDVIWVSSSEITKFIYKNEAFEKPFFCTYIKTSMFTFYLLGFICWPTWCWRRRRRRPRRWPRRKQTATSTTTLSPSTGGGNNYIYLDNQDEQEDEDEEDQDCLEEEEDEEQQEEQQQQQQQEEQEDINDDENNSNSGDLIIISDETTTRCLSNPIYVPVKTISCSSGTESDDSTNKMKYHHVHVVNNNNIRRAVRFNKLAEVRHMCDADAREALWARLSYQASLRVAAAAASATSGELALGIDTIKLPIYHVAKVAFVFCLLWFLANYTYQVALAETEAGIVNVLSSTSSSLFTLVLAALFPSNQTDRFTLSKLLAVLISICGIILISFSDVLFESSASHQHHQIRYGGALLSLISALFYSTYLVVLKRKIDHEDKIDIPLFFGFVGLFNMILLWPVFIFLHISELELFEWPNNEQLLLLLINGLLGTVISEALWLWGSFLTSSLMATVAITLTIPMTMLADVLLKQIAYPVWFYMGTVPMVIAFIALTLFSHYDTWDPVFDVLRCGYYFLMACRRHNNRFVRFRFSEVPSEQTEALLNSGGIINGDCNEHEA